MEIGTLFEIAVVRVNKRLHRQAAWCGEHTRARPGRKTCAGRSNGESFVFLHLSVPWPAKKGEGEEPNADAVSCVPGNPSKIRREK